MVIGNVRITKIGLINTFSTPITMATMKAVSKLLTETPGIK